MNDIDWSPKAIKQVLRIRLSDRQTIRMGVENLRNFPDCQNIKKLTAHKYQYRLRVGNYRVFFDFEGKAHIVHIEEVRKRDNSTY